MIDQSESKCLDPKKGGSPNLWVVGTNTISITAGATSMFYRLEVP